LPVMTRNNPRKSGPSGKYSSAHSCLRSPRLGIDDPDTMLGTIGTNPPRECSGQVTQMGIVQRLIVAAQASPPTPPAAAGLTNREIGVDCNAVVDEERQSPQRRHRRLRIPLDVDPSAKRLHRDRLRHRNYCPFAGLTQWVNFMLVHRHLPEPLFQDVGRPEQKGSALSRVNDGHASQPAGERLNITPMSRQADFVLAIGVIIQRRRERTTRRLKRYRGLSATPRR